MLQWTTRYIRVPVQNYGLLPIHCAANYPGENTAEIIKSLLLHDPDCVSKTIVSGDGGNGHFPGIGSLPLHIVCSTWDKSNVTELLYDLYPEAILIQNGRRQLPIGVMRKSADGANHHEYQQRGQDVIVFLESQMGYAYEAQNETAMRTPDRYGELPLHKALQETAPLGSIKLLVKGNPDAITVVDSNGMAPLGIACEASTLGVVKYLAELVPDRLNTCDMNKNYPLLVSSSTSQIFLLTA